MSSARRSSLFFVSLSCLVLFAAYVGRSSATGCYGAGMQITSFYTSQNETIWGEIGFNTSYPFLIQVNGTLLTNYSWVDPTKFGAELNLTEVQRTPLTNLSIVTNSSRVGVEYNCNMTTLNCTVRCLYGSEDGLTSGGQSGGGFCGDGFGLELLRNSPNLTARWIEVCDNLTTEQILDEASVHIGLSDHNETIICEFNTTVPIHYNVTLWKGGLNATTRPCHQEPTLEVTCRVEANLTNVENVSDVICTVWSQWPVRVNGYQYRDDDGDYYYDYSGDYDDDSNSPQVFPVHQARLGTGGHDGDTPTSNIGDSGSGLVVIAVVACVALVAVFVGMILRRRRSRRPGTEQVVYQPQFRSPYQTA